MTVSELDPDRTDRPFGPPHADDVVDELLGDSMDWQRLVRTYPASALVLAAGGGLWLGLRHGPAVIAAVTGFLAREATRRVNDFLGEQAL